MTLPPRRLTPALLQVDAILTRLQGAAALDEITRYLLDEFPQLHALSFYRIGPASGEHVAGTPPEGRDRAELPPSATEAVRTGALTADPATQEVSVIIQQGGRTVGVLLARPSNGVFDASDGRFLSEVARRIGAPAGLLPRPWL